MNSKTRDNNYTIIDLCAFLVASFALIVSIWNMVETRKYFRLSVQPKLSVILAATTEPPESGNSDTSARSFRLSVRNVGLGPAVIEKCKLTGTSFSFANRKEVQTKLESYFKDEKIEISRTDIRISTVGVGEFIAPDEELTLLEFPASFFPELEKMKEQIEKTFINLPLEIQYRSVYGEKKFKETNPPQEDEKT